MLPGHGYSTRCAIRSWRHADAPLPEFVRPLQREVLRERFDLLAPIAKRRQFDRDHTQPVVEVLAEFPFCDQLLQIRIRRGDDTHVHGEGGRLAERVDLAGFEEAQQLGLQVETELADLVEEQRPVLCGPDQARIVAICPGERAALEAEEMALDQFAWDCRAVERHERLLRACGVAMDGAGDDFLARAALAGQQHPDVGLSDLAGRQHDVAHLSRHHRVIVFGGELVDRPEGEPFLAFDAGAFDVLAGGDDEGDGVHRRLRLDVGERLNLQFDRTVARRADGKRANGSRYGDVAPGAEHFLGPVGATRDGAGRGDGGGVLENGDKARGDEFGAAGVHEE